MRKRRAPLKRLGMVGTIVDSRSAFEDTNRFIEEHAIRPVIDRVYRFEDLPAAFRLMEPGGPFGKIVIER
jgi:NADPH:quinone reductase-like Zn-dependent oxidoreductase